MVTATVQRNGNTSLSLRISQEELASLWDPPRQRLNPALKRLEKAGLLQIEYGGSTALDLDGFGRTGSSGGARQVARCRSYNPCTGVVAI
jgi:hypothetical protein